MKILLLTIPFLLWNSSFIFANEIQDFSIKLLGAPEEPGLKVEGEANQQYRIEVSADLKKWITLTSIQLTQQTQTLATGAVYRDEKLFVRGKKTTVLPFAKITAVTTSGTENSYNFSVTISSPDTGPAQYADWWEVLRPDGTLLYRRVLAHSHVAPNPFTRSGGPIAIQADDQVIIRAHMNNGGYGTEVFKGSVNGGFQAATISQTFSPKSAVTAPLPLPPTS